MYDNHTRTKTSGIGLFGILGVAFIILKLCGVINWSWIWVLAPFWGGFLLALIAGVLHLICVLAANR